MADEREVKFVFEAEDRISGPMKEAEQQLDATKQSASECTAEQQKTILKSVETLAALHGIQSGVSAVTNSIHTLGLVDEETYKTLQKVTAGIQLVVGAGELIKGVSALWQPILTLQMALSYNHLHHYLSQLPYHILYL